MDCSKAPSASLRTVCMQLNGWEPESSESLCKFSDGKLNKQAHECTVPGRGVMRKAYRKEYRVMSDEERERYHAALQETKKGGYFDSVAVSHAVMEIAERFADAGGAHAGVAFLYWDSAMDSYLPTPANSIIWTDAFMGNDQGPVTSGPFAGWTSYEKNRKLTRKVGADGAAFNETNIQEFMAFTDFHQVLAPTAPHAELQREIQGCPHMPTTRTETFVLFVGGDMHETNTSAYDPIFYSLHSFVDLLWEAWRLKRSTAARTSRPPEMNPFHPWRNTDGLSNNYTDELYEYAPRPACPSCSDSKYLFCLRSKFKCASKIRPGGNCQGLDPADQPCYNSTCQNGNQPCCET
ncbi:hypothetical protein M3Y99_01006500 [Aphelenchoides fujianensis]|nr:hypothetical protein M3Y99_01006500 [Aphelenchoides fujianensis]